METQRLLLYLAFGFVSLLLYQAWIQDYHMPEPAPVSSTANPDAQPGDEPAPPADPVADPGADDLPQSTAAATEAATASTEETESGSRISVVTDLMNIEIGTTGGTILGVDLLDYPVSVDKPNEPFTLMSDTPERFLVAQTGLQGRKGEPAPTHRELMQSAESRYALADGADTVAVPLTWESDNGIKVTKTLTFTRGSYEVAIDYQIENGSDEPWVVNQYRQLKRKPDTDDERQQFIYTYIGGVVSTPEDVYAKVDFGDMEDANLDQPVTDGWVAMIQHYFAAALIPVEGETNTAYTRWLSGENRYLIGMVSASQSVAPRSTGNFGTRAFIGPKIQEKLSAAAPNLELTVDYGWLTIIAQPLFWLLSFIHGLIGNWGWAIVGVTFVVKAVFYKLSEAGYKSMARMKKLQPKLLALKERHGDDRAKMGQATMELYKKEKVNPLGGCFPMIVQIPVFIALYWTLLESVELRQAPWILWIQDLSLRDPFYILPVIMAASMYFQQKLNPAPVDPIQAKVFQFLPLIFGIFFAFFPAGLVLYWVVNNTLSIAQQYYITRHVIGEGPDKPGGSSGSGGKKPSKKRKGGKQKETDAANDSDDDKAIAGNG